MEILVIFSAILGLVIGSFLNVVIYRLPLKMSIVTPPSHCTKCNTKLKWYHNIPVLSWMVLGGKCAFCGEKISIRYTIVEILNACLYVVCCLIFKLTIMTPIACLVCSILIVITFIDLQEKIIPDSLNIALLVLGIICCVFANDINTFQVNYIERIIGGVGIFALTLGVHYLWLYGFKKDALGGGDIKFLGAVGFIIGWKLILLTLILSCILGLIGVLLTSLFKRIEKSQEIPFAPYLALGVLISMFFGNQLIDLYLNLL